MNFNEYTAAYNIGQLHSIDIHNITTSANFQGGYSSCRSVLEVFPESLPLIHVGDLLRFNFNSCIKSLLVSFIDPEVSGTASISLLPTTAMTIFRPSSPGGELKTAIKIAAIPCYSDKNNFYVPPASDIRTGDYLATAGKCRAVVYRIRQYPDKLTTIETSPFPPSLSVSCGV